MTAIIETEKLTKSYGSHRGIVEVDLSVEQGEVFGFLGPNGAGKTTTIRTLLDLIRPPPGGARGAPPPPDRLPPRRVRPVRPPHRRPDARVLRQPSRWRGSHVPGIADRALRPGHVAPVQRVLEGEQAEGRPRRCPPASPRAALPRRADGRPRPAHPAELLRGPPRADRRGPDGPPLHPHPG